MSIHRLGASGVQIADRVAGELPEPVESQAAGEGEESVRVRVWLQLGLEVQQLDDLLLQRRGLGQHFEFCWRAGDPHSVLGQRGHVGQGPKTVHRQIACRLPRLVPLACRLRPGNLGHTTGRPANGATLIP